MAIRKIYWLFGNFPGYLENIQTIQNLSGPLGKYPDHPETFQNIWNISRSSGNFLDNTETFQTIQKLSRQSWNFPDGPETSWCNFKGYAQKFSGHAKIFQMAMPRWFLCLWFSIRCILYNMYVLFYLPSQLHVFCNTCMFSNRSYLLHAFSVFCMYVLFYMRSL